MGDIILFSSEKKDIGKTMLAIKTAIKLSNGGKKVLLLDLSYGTKKVSEYLNVSENIIYDIKDVLDETCSIEQAVINVKENLCILPYPRIANKLGDIKRESFTKLISMIKNEYDVTIVDIDNLSACYYVDFQNINGVIIVDNNDFSAVKDINIECEIAEKFGLKKIFVIINKYDKKSANKGRMLKYKEIKKMIPVDVTGIIEENSKYLSVDNDLLYNDEKSTLNNIIDEIKIKILL